MLHLSSLLITFLSIITFTLTSSSSNNNNDDVIKKQSPLFLSWSNTKQTDNTKQDDIIKLTQLADMVVGFVFGTQADFTDASFSMLAGAFEDKVQDSCSWKGVVDMLREDKVFISHKAVQLQEGVINGKKSPYVTVSLDELEEKMKSNSKGAYVVRMPSNARDDFQIKMYDAVIANVWNTLNNNNNKQTKAIIWIGQETEEIVEEEYDDDLVSMKRRRRRAAATTTTTSPTKSTGNTSAPTIAPTKPKDFIRMVPELFTGLILFLFLILVLIMFFCCCLPGIEAPSSWIKPGQQPAKGKEFN
jgi:hypothetical protein